MKRFISSLVCFFATYLYLYSLSLCTVDIHIIDAPRLTITTDGTSFTVHTGSSRKTIRAKTISPTISGNDIFIDGTKFAPTITIQAAPSMQINDISYPGSLVLSALPSAMLRVINRVDLEDYVAGVIAPEIGGGAPLHALKAQAVATRTVTISKILSKKHATDGYDLCSTTHCQVYRGLTGQTPTSIQASRETSGQILLHQGSPIEALYSSSCGGISELAGSLWQVNHPYLTSRTDRFCIDKNLMPTWYQRSINWEKEFSQNTLQGIFGLSNITSISTTRRSQSSRVEEMVVRSTDRSITISGQYEIRNRLSLNSTLFLVEKRGANFVFIGNGFGHGVGMCQTGAVARATDGHKYTDILSFYYPHTHIDKNWIKNNPTR
jgi:stage II sporulation protein D